jgi:hypothetical protein
MADFDLTQTDAQVQSILNDGQNMQGAGAQTTLTTESVLLKDVNGNYHKILKSSFTEAIRDTLAGLLVNNDKGTTINQIAAIASGDFGSITPANLASVLGGYPTNHAMVQISNSNKTGLELAKEYYTNQMQEGDVAFLFITPSDANEFATIYKNENAGRIELHPVSDGTTIIYKKGYNDNDFVLVE